MDILSTGISILFGLYVICFVGITLYKTLKDWWDNF